MKKRMIIVIATVVIILEGAVIGLLLYEKRNDNIATNGVTTETVADSENIDDMIENYERESEVLAVVLNNYMMLRGIDKGELDNIFSGADNEYVNVTFPQLADYSTVKDFEKAYFEALDEADRLIKQNKWNFTNYSKAYMAYLSRFKDDNMDGARDIVISDYNDDFDEYIKAFFRIIGEQNGRTFDDEYFEQFNW